MKNLVLVLAGVTVLATAANAQVVLNGFTYSQNFDSLPNSGTGTTNSWSNNGTLQGWLAFRDGGSAAAGAVPNISALDGSSNSGALYSFGTTNSNERALGTVGSGTPGNFNYGVALRNNSGADWSSVTISYVGEQWREGQGTTTGAAAQTVDFAYFISSLTETTDFNTATYTDVDALDFTSPIFGNAGAGVALDGNATANRVAINGTITFATPVANGQSIYLRWRDINHVGNDHGLGIDDLSFTATPVPEPGTIAALGLGAVALLRRRNKK